MRRMWSLNLRGGGAGRRQRGTEAAREGGGVGSTCRVWLGTRTPAEAAGHQVGARHVTVENSSLGIS